MRFYCNLQLKLGKYRIKLKQLYRFIQEMYHFSELCFSGKFTFFDSTHGWLIEKWQSKKGAKLSQSRYRVQSKRKLTPQDAASVYELIFGCDSAGSVLCAVFFCAVCGGFARQ